MTRQGWRLFTCDECDRLWSETSRDAASLSGEGCTCGNWCVPIAHKIDETVQVNEYGNLVEATKVIEL